MVGSRKLNKRLGPISSTKSSLSISLSPYKRKILWRERARGAGGREGEGEEKEKEKGEKET